MRSFVTGAVVVVVGALLGSFLGRAIGMMFPHGRLVDLLSREITAGLHPTHLDLSVVDFTLGCMFRFNVTSVLGIMLAALMVKVVMK